MRTNVFSVDWSKDGFVWESKQFKSYDTAIHFYTIISIKYSPNVRMYEI